MTTTQLPEVRKDIFKRGMIVDLTTGTMISADDLVWVPEGLSLDTLQVMVDIDVSDGAITEYARIVGVHLHDMVV